MWDRAGQDEALQLRGIEFLFAQQTQAKHEAQAKELTEAGAASADASPAMRRSLEAAIAVFANHQANWNLLLKASQFLSVLLAEPSAQQLLPQAVVRSAAEAVLAASAQLSEAQTAAAPQGAGPTPAKLITWLLSLLALLLPAVEPWLRQKQQSQEFVKTLLNAVISRLLTESELPAEAVILKSVQLIPLLPMESWIQQACLDSGAIHSFALARQRVVAKKGGDQLDPTLAKAVQSAIRMVPGAQA
ncbi:HCc2 [Symbiodinium natans]|uniref:HCc2 protein n=1 Tax=Symbiodinium natans TaxID=878477 RepID=A0A812PI39_9DINO|nr:HCc2 [Symbiodinium natans]